MRSLSLNKEISPSWKLMRNVVDENLILHAILTCGTLPREKVGNRIYYPLNIED
jgi:hypothetical protein